MLKWSLNSLNWELNISQVSLTNWTGEAMVTEQHIYILVWPIPSFFDHCVKDFNVFRLKININTMIRVPPSTFTEDSENNSGNIHRIHSPSPLPLAKGMGGSVEKKRWFWGLDFKSWGGSLTIRGDWNLRGAEGARFSRAAMFFYKHVISVATLLLIIHITMYILISLI